MSEEYIICPGCNKRIRPLRRYPLEPLAKWFGLSIPQTCRLARVEGTPQKEARCHGITRRVVDRICHEFKAHPYEIWPEVVDHDVQDPRPCDYCKEPFYPAQRNSRFCCLRCRRRALQGEQNKARRKRYAEDPEFRQRKIAAAQRRHAEQRRLREEQSA